MRFMILISILLLSRVGAADDESSGYRWFKASGMWCLQKGVFSLCLPANTRIDSIREDRTNFKYFRSNHQLWGFIGFSFGPGNGLSDRSATNEQIYPKQQFDISGVATTTFHVGTSIVLELDFENDVWITITSDDEKQQIELAKLLVARVTLK